MFSWVIVLCCTIVCVRKRNLHRGCESFGRERGPLFGFSGSLSVMCARHLICLSTRWHPSTTASRILTVSIDNPTARTQPEWVFITNTAVTVHIDVSHYKLLKCEIFLVCRPPAAWTLHPPAVSSVPLKVETEEKKIPKGVPLQFDINSVGKPVSVGYFQFLCGWIQKQNACSSVC